ncbi:MAG: M23 family metallopeptidase [Defluviitaleaceae bacterium]|nr:M23 family metallopeptidase [Defluviitaleaceae bacterium]
MFLKKNPQTTPVVKVKKASDIINTGSHKQKKYLSLMLVPSYSTGKTRTLRIPRATFYAVLVALFVVSAVIAGLQIRADHMRRVAEQYSHDLADTQDQFEAFRLESYEEFEELLAAYRDVHEDLSEEEIRHMATENLLRREHQAILDGLGDVIADQERQIEEALQILEAAIEGLTARAFIPPIAPLVAQLQASQAEVRASFESASYDTYMNGLYGYADEYINGSPIGVVLSDGVIPIDDDGVIPISAAMASIAPMTLYLPPLITEEYLHNRLEENQRTLDMLMALKEDFVDVRERILPYCRNFPTLWPVNVAISSPFGSRANPFGGGGWQFHSGVDLAAPMGTPIRAAGGGTVTRSGWVSGGLGIVVEIYHGNGISTVYAHNRENLVSVGDRVERGQVIARIGMTGATTGPHVHYEVIVNGVRVNPIHYMLER